MGVLSALNSAKVSLSSPVILLNRASIMLCIMPLGMVAINGLASVASFALCSKLCGSRSWLKRWNKKSLSGVASTMRAVSWSLPSWRTNESGSSPSGNNKKRAWRPSTIKGRQVCIARSAALSPAASPSKQNTTSLTNLKIRSKWKLLVLVPRVATA